MQIHLNVQLGIECSYTNPSQWKLYNITYTDTQFVVKDDLMKTIENVSTNTDL